MQFGPLDLKLKFKHVQGQAPILNPWQWRILELLINMRLNSVDKYEGILDGGSIFPISSSASVAANPLYDLLPWCLGLLMKTQANAKIWLIFFLCGSVFSFVIFFSFLLIVTIRRERCTRWSRWSTTRAFPMWGTPICCARYRREDVFWSRQHHRSHLDGFDRLQRPVRRRERWWWWSWKRQDQHSKFNH